MTSGRRGVYAVVTSIVLVAGCGDLPKPKDDPTAFASNLTPPQDLAVGAQALYWTSAPPPFGIDDIPYGTIQSAPLSGGTHQAIVASTRKPSALAVDDARVYWFDWDVTHNQQELMVANLDGSGAEVLLPSLPDLLPNTGTRLLARDGTLYWGGTQGVHTVSTDGGTVATIPGTDGGTYALLVAVDVTGLYWGNANSSGGMEYKHAQLDGGNPVTMVTTGLSAFAKGFTVDGTNAYWFSDSISTRSALYKVPVTGGTPEKVFDYPPGGMPSDLAADEHGIYFCDQSTNGLGVYQVDGGTYVAIERGGVLGYGTPHTVRMNAHTVYWVTSSSVANSDEIRSHPR